MKDLTKEQAKLASLMSDISEEMYCAGWMCGLEYALWAFINSEGDFKYGLGVIPDKYRTELREASDDCGGWIAWSDADEAGEEFVPIDKWKAHIERQK